MGTAHTIPVSRLIFSSRFVTKHFMWPEVISPIIVSFPFVSFSPHDDGGQQVQSNDWVWGSDDSHDAPKEFKSLHELSYGPEQYYTEDKPCTHRPKTPMNSNLKCTLKTNSCKATCLKDYQFPNGDTSMPIVCEDGVWSEIPSCERMCDKYTIWSDLKINLFPSVM